MLEADADESESSVLTCVPVPPLDGHTTPALVGGNSLVTSSKMLDSISNSDCRSSTSSTTTTSPIACASPIPPEEILEHIAEFAAPLADTFANVHPEFRKGAKKLRRWQTCADCLAPFRACDQIDGLGITAASSCLPYHPGKIKQWEQWEDEPSPGFQWTCCNAFVFDPTGMESGQTRFDEERLKAEALALKGCTARKHSSMEHTPPYPYAVVLSDCMRWRGKSKELIPHASA